MSDDQLSPERIELIRKQLENIPFARFLGIELEEIRSGTATLRMPVTEDLKRNNGIVHGGAIASLIDSATAFAILYLDPQRQSLTIDLTINFLRPLSDGYALAKATIIRAGRRIIVVSAEAFDSSGNLLATALSSYISDSQAKNSA
jgi:acyl-CoA thioesterase